MTKKKGEGQFLPWVLLFGAIITFGLTLWLLYQDRPASAGVSIVMLFGLLIFRVLPELESLKISGVLEARLRRKLNEAEELTARLRQSVETFSKLGVALIVVGNRWGGLQPFEEKELVEDIMAAARSAGVDPETQRQIVLPQLSYAALDLFFTFKKLVDGRLERYRKAIEAGADAFRAKDSGAVADIQGYNAYLEANRGFSPVKVEFSPSMKEDPRLKDVTALCKEYLANFRFDEADRRAFEAYAVEIGQLADRVWAEGSIPEEVMAHIEHFQQPDAYQQKLEELFAGRTDEWKPFGSV